jgi:hypothetical protein
MSSPLADRRVAVGQRIGSRSQLSGFSRPVVIAGYFADWQVLVSFSYVRRRSAPTTLNKQPRSRTLLNRGEPRPTDLESVLSSPASPRPEMTPSLGGACVLVLSIRQA